MINFLKAFTPQELIERGAPQVFTTSSKGWVTKLVDWFENHPDGPQRKLYPAQSDMVFIRLIAYALSIICQEAQEAWERRWILFAQGEFLDIAAANNSTFRLKAQPAVTTIEFTLAEALATDLFIAAGTKVAIDKLTSTLLHFQTNEDVLILAGQTSGSVTATVNHAGFVGNGIAIGRLVYLVEPVEGLSVSNTDISNGGADEEEDQSLRLRALNAHDRISKAGGEASYKEQVLAYSSAIAAVKVVRPQEGHIWIYVLLETGAPSQTILDDIDLWMAPLEKRPQGDTLTSKPPEAVTYTIAGTVRYRGNPTLIQADIEAELNKVASGWAKRLAPYLAKKALDKVGGAVEGVEDIDLDIVGPANRQLAGQEFPVLIDIDLTMEAANA
ncbi:baseplate J/gp47 family protein [Maritalea porphyrae]|uniref:baseplate J/gp47 family protein n=1 Tax=Maritalea porphyrae TaxID=880732 RepID=UPI0022AE665B|nr:baseplate J/gp47 family protein [Maritalea porphyrae]MCZ4273294.1 baseplate J/gp47 family protein [Maritalea porphyrae]